MVCLGNEQRSFCHFWDFTQVLHFRLLFLTLRATPWLLRDSSHGSRYSGHLSWICPFQSISVHWFLNRRYSLLLFDHLLFDHFQFALFHVPNVPGSYAILLFTASNFTSITNHIHNWVLFLLWLHLFSLSGFISPLFNSSILGTYWPGKFIFQCYIFLPFHSVHGVLKARILKWFAVPFSSGPRFVRTLHYEPSVLGGPTWHGS